MHPTVSCRLAAHKAGNVCGVPRSRESGGWFVPTAQDAEDGNPIFCPPTRSTVTRELTKCHDSAQRNAASSLGALCIEQAWATQLMIPSIATSFLRDRDQGSIPVRTVTVILILRRNDRNAGKKESSEVGFHNLEPCCPSEYPRKAITCR